MRRAVTLMLGCAVAAAGVILVALAVSGLLTGSPLQELGLLVYGSYGPWVVIVASVLFGLGLVVRRFGSRILGWFDAAFAAVALLAALVVCAPQAVVAFGEGFVPTPANTLGIVTSAPPRTDRQVFATLEDGTELEAAVWLPDRDAIDRRPAVVWLHGGDFDSGDVLDESAWHQELADAGYPVIAVSYRLAPPPRWNEASADAACALTWVREQANDWNVDPNRVILGGTGAGGNLALTTAYGLGQPVEPEEPEEDDEGSQADSRPVPAGVESSCGDRPDPPHAVIAVSAPVDLSVPTAAGDFPYQDFLGGRPGQAREAYEFASPVNRVHADGLPRTLLITGQADPIVNDRSTQAFVAQLRSEQTDVRHIAYPFGGHEFDAQATLGEAVRNTATLHWLEQWYPLGI